MSVYPPYRTLEGLTLRKHWNQHGRILNLASGQDYRPSSNGTTWVNADRYAQRVDERVDLFSFPWPWSDASFDGVLSHQFLEHVPHTINGEDALNQILREIARILKPGGRFLASTPYAGAPSDHSNTTHYRSYNKHSFRQLGTGDNWDVQSGGLSLRVVKTKTIRVLRFTRFFDSSYHIPKHLGFFLNIGRKHGLVFVFERVH